MSRRIELRIENGRIELGDYHPSASLGDLIDDLDVVRTTEGLRTSSCHVCGECCADLIPLFGMDLVSLAKRFDMSLDTLVETTLVLPEKPDLTERREAIASLARDSGTDTTTAALLFEFNSAEPITFQRSANGVCLLQKNLLCTIYGDHPVACRFYQCTMAERLSVLYENVVRQGIWHSYAVLGWIDEAEISHNPFVGAGSVGEIPLDRFDVDLSEALEALFFYF